MITKYRWTANTPRAHITNQRTMEIIRDLGLEAEVLVNVRVRNRLTGYEYTIRAKYLVGADGARSQIAEDIDTPFEGAMDIGGSMNIQFTADLSHLVAHRPSILYWVFPPGSNIGGLGAGLVRCVRPWNEWL